ncbi:nuclease-related domain-containing protein [Gallaecimonas xiamenensis]|uniref:Zn-finger domain-containing protein (Topoisomerase type I-like) n=1 Tax=Gallaecimonas xiamenensis 3-C-1 TaxID=745411 RepID=K2JR87_9GAMM|nr:NERD domain-containing protein [Gallaecimonas xiamenensis]EKE77878.1 Zn-finger domain-containing protein (topoisomerase type I-like) [Gallaecimonas xiamenensis 3-C-1]
MLSLWWLLLPLALGLLVRLPAPASLTGAQGERKLARLLARHLDERYLVVHDVTLAIDGSTTQIDHLVLSPYGVFVIETKTYSGWIFGSEHQAQWTQQHYRHKTRFQNPLRQNYKHVLAVCRQLGLPATQVHSVVAFMGSARFKTAMPANVCTGAEVLIYIRGFHQPCFGDAVVSALASRLERRRLAPGRATTKQHLANLKAAEQGQPCPACGGAMVLRKARNSQERFWGCRRFPQCRGTRPLVLPSLTDSNPL